jgi:hypothetical protein
MTAPPSLTESFGLRCIATQGLKSRILSEQYYRALYSCFLSHRLQLPIAQLQSKSILTLRMAGYESPKKSHEGHHRHKPKDIHVFTMDGEQWKGSTYRGWRTIMPNLDANAPVMNGRIADPACPNPAIQPESGHNAPVSVIWQRVITDRNQPMLPVSRFRGMIRPA